jgi:hypothetical protein
MKADPERLDFAGLDARAEDFDACVARTPSIDLYCSSSAWVQPARRAFTRGAQPLVLAGDACYAALMTLPIRGGRLAAVPLEFAWRLACPFVGADPSAAVDLLGAAVESPESAVDALVLSGFVAEGPAFSRLRRFAQAAGWSFDTLELDGRYVADLSGGVDAFMGRRSAGFRANTRRERRLAARDGVTYEALSIFDSDASLMSAWTRIQAIERRSWKGREGHGIDADPMRGFYRDMTRRLARRGALRVVFARRADEDIAYVFGGVFAGTYRGLQVSFDDAFRPLAPGVLVHLEMIERLCAEGVIAYDLGSEMPYKARWGERGVETVRVAMYRAGQ